MGGGRGATPQEIGSTTVAEAEGGGMDGEGKERGADVHRCSGGEDSGGNAALTRKALLVDAVLWLVDAAPPPPPCL